MISALGRAMRFPFAPDESRNAPIEAAMPMQMVETSGLMYCMVSYMARPEVTLPPGLFI